MAKGNDINERFIKAFEYLEVKGVIKSKGDAATKLNCSPQVITETLKGRMKATTHILQNLFVKYGVRPDFVFLNEKPILQSEKTVPNIASKMPLSGENIVNEPMSGYNKSLGKYVPLVSIEAFGGKGKDVFRFENKDIQDYYVVPDFKEVSFMIRVTGNSMAPTYNSGDIIACKVIKDKAFIQWGKTYVVSTKDQGILIVRIKKGDGKTHLVAVSDNSAYDPFEIPLSDIVGHALVIGVIRLE